MVEQEQISKIREDVAYMRGITETNSQQIGQFYKLLDDHMAEEEEKVAGIKNTLWFMSIGMALILIENGYPQLIKFLL